MWMFYAELYNLLGLISHAKTLFYIWVFFRSCVWLLCVTRDSFIPHVAGLSQSDCLI